jgi:hypothetical protein
MTEEGATPLEEIMKKIDKEFDGDLGLDADADTDELKSFLKHVLPDYDENKVYPSDIRKLISWYKIIKVEAPVLLKEEEGEENEDNKAE